MDYKGMAPKEGGIWDGTIHYLPVDNDPLPTWPYGLVVWTVTKKHNT
jgi:hypothetical protein